MSFLSPLGLLALLGIPAVLALHLFRRQLQHRRVAGLFLFAPDALEATAGRRRTRLLRSASLWLELAAALLVALWLGGLALGATSHTEHLVVVLDDSASMGAAGDGGSTRDRAVEAARAAAGALPSSAWITVIHSGPRPQIALGPRAPIGQLDAALARWAPGRTHHDLGPALELGRELDPTAMLLVTDHPTTAVPDGCRLRAVGAARPNAAVISARRIAAGPEQEKVYVDLRATGAAPMPTAVRVLAQRPAGAEAALLSEQSVTLQPGRTTHLSITLPRTDAALEVALLDDALAVDNSAVLLPAPRKVVRVTDLLAPETAALLRLDKMLGALSAVRAVADPTGADLVFAPGPGQLREGTTEVVVAPIGDERDDWMGPFLLERRHPLLVGMTLEGVVWGAGRGSAAGLPLILAGNQTLLGEDTRRGATRLHLNLDAARTNLAASPDWPIFLSNVVEQTRQLLPGPGAVNLRVGEPIEYRFTGAAEQVAEIALVDPQERRRRARGVRLLTWESGVPGVHRLVLGERELARFAVQFVDASESDLTQCGDADVAARARPAAADSGSLDSDTRSELTVLALLLLAAVALDWWCLGRSR